jgi:cytochrome c-type biogenesis protein CcmH/NrfG
MNQPQAAADFLRDGLRANPDSYEILFALGRVYFENFKNNERARNLWFAAWKNYLTYEKKSGEIDLTNKRQILMWQARLEEADNQFPEAIAFLQQLNEVVPPQLTDAHRRLLEQIDDVKKKMAAPK